MMDNCIVCCKSNDDTFSRITTVSSEWKEWNIQRIIEKHLWWWYLKPPSSKELVQWICRNCWQEISSFHNFYIEVEKENKEYYNLFKSAIKENLEEITASVDIKLEDGNSDQFLMLADNQLRLEKLKRGRKKKLSDPTEILTIERLKNKCKKKSSDFSEITHIEIDIKSENKVQDIPEFTNPELDITSVLTTEHSSSMDWDDCLFNDNEDYNCEDNENDLEDNNDNNKTNTMTSKKQTRKYKRKDIKMKIEKKPKAIKKSSDELIAEMDFELMCNVCNSKMENFNQLKVHFRQEHNMVGYATCCNKKFFKPYVLVEHLNVHKDPNYYKCPKCDKALSSKFSFVSHMKTHQLNETRETVFTCDICNKSFLKKPVFERHVLTHVPEEERHFQCELCDKKFASDGMRKQHQTLTHSKKYAKFCDICGKVFYNNIPFERHMAEHKGEPSPVIVKCEICGKEIANKYLLKHHIKIMHTKENQQEQICPYCSKVSPNLNSHKHHIKYTHTLERKHACHMCDKKFRRPLELKEHLSTHTGEPLYTCPHCPRTFISNANMHKHRKLVHRKEWEEGRMKKVATALASKQFIKSLTTEENETAYTEIIIDESEMENNIVANEIELDF
ncbi:uncharacterized protein ACRADG_009253 [Cochliomyia hominivorax]